MASETLKIEPSQGNGNHAIVHVRGIQVACDKATYEADRGAYVCWLNNQSVAEIPADEVPSSFANGVRRTREYGETWDREDLENW